MGEDGSLPAAVHISILYAKAFRVGGRTCNELEGLSHELVLVVCHFGLVTSERKDLLSVPVLIMFILVAKEFSGVDHRKTLLKRFGLGKG